MKKAPGGSCKRLFFKGIAMQKNIYKHFFASNIGLKNGVIEYLIVIDIRKTVPEIYYAVSNIGITVAAKSKPLFIR
jgi:hypothetical protein